MNTIDMRGKPCPIPVIETKKVLAKTAAGTEVAILVDNDTARQNLEKLARGQGHGFRHETTPDGGIRVVMTAAAATTAAGAAPGDDGSGLVVAIGSDRMGRGDDDLGRTLMKNFLFSLAELETPPEHILFFNSGVHLTCAGSAALDDLAALTAKGASVNSCGACLNFYGKTDTLQVGSVSNMYFILRIMAQAKRLINLS